MGMDTAAVLDRARSISLEHGYLLTVVPTGEVRGYTDAALDAWPTPAPWVGYRTVEFEDKVAAGFIVGRAQLTDQLLDEIAASDDFLPNTDLDTIRDGHLGCYRHVEVRRTVAPFPDNQLWLVTIGGEPHVTVLIDQSIQLPPPPL